MASHAAKASDALQFKTPSFAAGNAQRQKKKKRHRFCSDARKEPPSSPSPNSTSAASAKRTTHHASADTEEWGCKPCVVRLVTPDCNFNVTNVIDAVAAETQTNVERQREREREREKERQRERERGKWRHMGHMDIVSDLKWQASPGLDLCVRHAGIAKEVLVVIVVVVS